MPDSKIGMKVDGRKEEKGRYAGVKMVRRCLSLKYVQWDNGDEKIETWTVTTPLVRRRRNGEQMEPGQDNADL